MSECTSGELRDLLPELVNDRLDAAMRQRVEEHVASCTECADELALLRSLRPALLSEPAIDAQRIAAAVRAQTAGSAGSASRAPAREGIATRWRVAIAAAALLAIGALGYVASVHRKLGAPEIAVAPTAVHAPSPEIAAAPLHPTPAPSAPTTFASSGVLENVSDLSDDEVRTLTASLDTLSSLPDAEPSPGIDPLGASLEDLSAGGT